MSAPKEQEHPSADEIGGLAMLAPDDTERVAFERHQAECASCRAEWQRATRLASLLGTLAAPPPPSEKSLARSRARIHALMATESAPRPTTAEPTLGRGLAIAAAVLVSVVGAFSLSGPVIDAPRVLLALTTIGVAVLLPSMALRSDRHAIGTTIAALALSFALAGVDYAQVAMVTGHAIGCLQSELAVGALPLAAMLYVAHGRGRRTSALATAAAGAAGALAGQGVLLTTCAADESVLHVVFFHAAGVVIGAALGGGLGALFARRTA